MNKMDPVTELYHEGKGNGDDGEEYIYVTLYRVNLPYYESTHTLYILSVSVGWTDYDAQPDPLWRYYAKDMILNTPAYQQAIRQAIRIFDKLVKDHPNLEAT